MVAAAALLFVWGDVSPAVAQNKPKKVAPPPHPPPKPPPNQRANPNRPPQESPAREIERFQNMSPEQREKELAKLPPARRARVQEQMERFDKMPPAQRAQALKRLQAFEDLPPQRRVAVRQQIQSLRGLPRQERLAWLNSEEMQKNYSPAEQKLIRESFPQAELH
jgi:hypothetical protein